VFPKVSIRLHEAFKMLGRSMKLGVENLETRENPSGWSFWDDTYVGAILSGGAQGAANIVNGVQDIGIGVLNLPAKVYNNTAGYVGGGDIGYIPSPDWSKNLIVENDSLHGTSKFVGANGVLLLVTLGTSGALSTSRVAAAEGGEAGAAGGVAGAAGGEAGVAGAAGGEAGAAVGGMGNIGSHGAVNVSTLLNSATRWLGAGYREIAPGVYRSADGLRQFRMTNADLLPTHGAIGPHVHFEALNGAGQVIENLHVAILL
jgi:hypothetical protein